MAIRPRNIGEILDGAIRLYRQDLGLYMFTAIIATLPMTLIAVLGYTGAESVASSIAVIVLAPFAIVGAIAVWTALTIQMHERLEGRQPTLGSSVKQGLALVLRVVWAFILAYIAMLVGLVIAFIPLGIIAAIAGVVLPQAVAVIVLVVLATVTLVLYFGYVMAGLALFLPSIVVERLSGYGAIKRGYELAKGGQFRIVAVIALSWILVFVPFSATYFLTGTASTLVDPNAVAEGMVSTGQLVVQQILALVATGFTTPYLVACMLLLYFDQRVRREAYDLQAEADALAG